MSRKMKTAEHTDLGNAERFVREHVRVARYVGSWEKWLTWDGARWVLDVTAGAERLGKETVRVLLGEASAAHASAIAALEKSVDDEGLSSLAKDRARNAKAKLDWAIKSHDASRIRAMVGLARSATELAVTHEDLDADAWALNVANGTIDLRTGDVRPHDPGDLITKLAPIEYDADATCPTWDAFVSRAMGGSAELVDFLRRMMGYALTGVIREHVLGFLFGGGANGKSTFISTMHVMLGDYAVRAPRGLLFRSRGERHETELTTLHGARFVSCSEVDDSAVFDEAQVKDLTGGDPITARRMRENHWTFAPTHKLFMAGNHKPRVRGVDEGIWRRIRLVPWTVTIPAAERDTSLPDKLRAELPGILAWCVRGCLEWQRAGLGEPSEVRAATESYREESDPLLEYFTLHCVFETEARTPRRHVREAYENYCKENGAEPLGARRFAEGLRSRGVTEVSVKYAGKVMDGWRGVRLKTEAERDREDEPVGGRDQVGADSRLVSICARPRGPDTENSPYQVPTPYSSEAASGVRERPGDDRAPTPGTDDAAPTLSAWHASQGVA